VQKIAFNVPTPVGEEFDYIRAAIEKQHVSGNGTFTQACQAFLEKQLGGGKVLLTHSCTAALEMSALLANIGPGDEVIMPSYTFSSTANAFVLRGAVPVFIDIRLDTLNIDETLIEQAIGPRTRAICVVHYAGVSAAMDQICEIARRHGLVVIEDAAQGLFSNYRKRPLGTLGTFGAFSFHETKNIISGEGGALIVNDPEHFERAETIWEKGTNRAQFKRGEVSKYTWVDLGSSFLPSDMIAAFLLSQLQKGDAITQRRLDRWHRYHAAFEELAARGVVQRPHIPAECDANGHIYYLLARDEAARDRALRYLQAAGVNAIIHYVPLHSAPAGLRFGRVSGPMTNTASVAARLLRLPIHSQLDDSQLAHTIAAVEAAFRDD
jgi:dTDP-4-amino-4,6-dideoxygalactose transaminase